MKEINLRVFPRCHDVVIVRESKSESVEIRLDYSLWVDRFGDGSCQIRVKDGDGKETRAVSVKDEGNQIIWKAPPRFLSDNRAFTVEYYYTIEGLRVKGEVFRFFTYLMKNENPSGKYYEAPISQLEPMRYGYTQSDVATNDSEILR